MTLTSDSPASITTARGLSVAIGGGGGLSGGSAALGWSASSLSNGETITITTDGTNNFGSKVKAQPVVWDMGAEFLNEGEALTGHATASDGDSINSSGIFSGATGQITLSRPHRHQRIDRHYLGAANTKAFIGYDSLLDASTASRKHYSCFRIRLPIDPRLVRTIPITESSGAFDQGASGELGESLTVTISGTEYGGNLIAIFDGKMALSVEGVSITSGTGLIGVTGLESGATATLNSGQTGYAGAPPAKLYRINQGASDGVLSVLQLGIEQFWIESNASGVDEIGMQRFDNGPDFTAVALPGEWFFVEMTQDWSDGSALTGTARLIGSQGQAIMSIPAQNGAANWDDLPVLLLGIGLDSSVDHKLNVEFGEVVIDETAQRVAIGNNSNYDLCTQIEVQRVKTWGASKITAEAYQGAFDSLSGKHLFVFDESNNVIGSGVQL